MSLCLTSCYDNLKFHSEIWYVLYSEFWNFPLNTRTKASVDKWTNVTAVKHTQFHREFEWRAVKYSPKLWQRRRAVVRFAFKPLLSPSRPLWRLWRLASPCRVFKGGGWIWSVRDTEYGQTGSWTEAWRAGLTNEIQDSTVTRQPNVQTPLHLSCKDLTTTFPGAIQTTHCCLFPFFQYLFTRPFFFFNSTFLNLSLILVSFPLFPTLPFPYAFLYFLRPFLLIYGGCRNWLRHCATSWKVVGSIHDGFTEIFHWYNFSGRTMALRSTQLLTEMSSRNISWRIQAAGA